MLSSSFEKDSCTTPLSRHLERCHPEIIHQINSKKAEKSVSSGQNIRDFVTYGGQFFQSFLKWVVFTYQPINTCENEYFRRMCYELNPKVQYFDRHKVTKVVSEQAARVKATLMKELGDKHFALTCDHWTSLAGHNYLGVTAHYITESWKLRSFTLSCNEHTGSSKADDILRELKNAWTTNELSSDRMISVVTDTAPVMRSFGRQLPKFVPHFYCVDHVLKLTTVLL